MKTKAKAPCQHSVCGTSNRTNNRQNAIFSDSRPLQRPVEVFSGRIPDMNSETLHGNADISHTPKRIGHGNAISPTFLSARSSITFTALSASMKKGIGHVLRSVMRDLMNPGHITLTHMPSRFSIPRSESPQLFIAAFVAA